MSLNLISNSKSKILSNIFEILAKEKNLFIPILESV